MFGISGSPSFSISDSLQNKTLSADLQHSYPFLIGYTRLSAKALSAKLVPNHHNEQLLQHRYRSG